MSHVAALPAEQSAGIPQTMRAVRYHSHGGPEVLVVDEVPVPEVGPGEVLIRVTCLAVNGWDTRARAGNAPQIPGRPPTPLPFQIGREAVGEIVAVGSGVRTRTVGDRVMLLPQRSCGRCVYCQKHGSHLCVGRELPGQSAAGLFADYVLAREEDVLRTPDNLTDQQAVPILWAYGTALHMMHVAELGIGDTVLVTAAASSMGVACIQLAKLAGASTVIALTRSAAKHPALVEAGADAVVDHRDPGAADDIRKLVPEMGVDVVFDNHGGQELLDFSMDVLDLGGRYVLISSEATTFGNSLGIDPLRLIGKHISLRVCRSATHRDQETVVRLAEKGKIAMPIAEVVPLAEVARAHELQERSAHVGKILVCL